MTPPITQCLSPSLELAEAEMRAAVEMLDASELKSLIQKIYAADGGLH